jgi:coenzyme F420-0:L-glutamate ligase/coenzyme F420-1:gamma-L-glutamate ligase
MSRRLELIGLADFPRVVPGDNLAQQVLAALADNALELTPGDVIVVAQKVVSKAEGRYVRLAEVTPGSQAHELAAQADKDPRQMEVLLRESAQVLRVRPGVVIVEHRNGYVLANAGIDRSNIPNSQDDPQVLLLPEDADRSAAALSAALSDACGITVPVLINDSVGRAWRNGTVGICIGCAGVAPLHNQIGERDMFNNVLEVTEPAVADELAAAASLVMGQAAEGCPVVLVRGATLPVADTDSRALLREASQDMFR